MYERPHHRRDVRELHLELGREHLFICESGPPRTTNRQPARRGTTSAKDQTDRPVGYCERAAFQEIDVPNRTAVSALPPGYRESERGTHLCDLSMPLGATLSSSSMPNTFCRKPFGCGRAGPKSATKSGAEMTCRKRREERCRLFLCAAITAAAEIVGREQYRGDRRSTHRIVTTSFLPGHQLPAAMMLSPPALTASGLKIDEEAQQ